MARMEATQAADLILERVIDAYRASITRETFNGIKLGEVSHGVDEDALKLGISKLLEERKIDVLNSETQQNPHIRRFEAPTVERQLRTLDTQEKYHTCLYPTRETIKSAYDLSFLNPKPFAKALAEGDPQIKPIFFELGAIDRYRLDPRFDFEFRDYVGMISMKSETEKTGPIPERDQIYVQTFGLGIDDDTHPLVCVFLRYLSKLSPEHQRHWETFISNKKALIHENYYRPAILGQVWKNTSALEAIRLSIQAINKICNALYQGPLFLQPAPSLLHYNLSPFMRPTKNDYLIFVHELDKILSENINIKLFDEMLNRFDVVNNSDGTIERKPKGSIQLLEEFLVAGILDSETIEIVRKEIISPLRKVRRERQPIAHTVIQNEFDIAYIERRRELLKGAAFALCGMFYMFRRRPRAPQIPMPDWLETGTIEVL